MSSSSQLPRGFNLLELVIVIVIIGIIGAIAIPRFSRGAASAADGALQGNLAILRKAIELYTTEHGSTFPSAAKIAAQLTQYSDDAGSAQATKDATHIYGPYLRNVSTLPVGAKKGSSGIAAADGARVGWIYDEATGEISANTTTETNDSGKLYNTY